MKRMMVFLLLSASGPGLHAQTTVPPGTVLPVRLDSSVSSAKSTPEQTVRARVMQNILLPGGSEIRQGSEVIGHLVRLSPASGNSPAELILTFDSIKLTNHTVPLRTSLRALASNLDVADAGTPNYFDDATPSTHGTTTQVGGEVVYRGGGHVMNGETVVGEPVSGGVLCRTRANRDKGCRGAVDGNDQPQSLWIFSSDACGSYDLPHLTITHAARQDPQGEIVLTSANGRALKIQSDSAMLLRVL